MRGCSGKSAGNFNPRPPCGGRLSGGDPFAKGYISTHALLAEGDQADNALNRLHTHFNPRPPCGGRPELGEAIARGVCISTHALLAEGDGGVSTRRANAPLFQPTPSLRRATWRRPRFCPCVFPISTHALLAEGDTISLPRLPLGSMDFNPRPPCGGRPVACRSVRGQGIDFNPRPPCGGRLVEYDIAALDRQDFNPRPPCGGRPAFPSEFWQNRNISTHALLAEGDRRLRPLLIRPGVISTHALLAEGDGTDSSSASSFGIISTHALLAEGDP